MVSVNKVLIAGVLAKSIHAAPFEKNVDLQKREVISDLVNGVESIFSSNGDPLLDIINARLNCIADVLFGSDATTVDRNRYLLAVVIANGYYDYKAFHQQDAVQKTLQSLAESDPGLINTLAEILGLAFQDNIAHFDDHIAILAKFIESCIQVVSDNLQDIGDAPAGTTLESIFYNFIKTAAEGLGLVIQGLGEEFIDSADLIIDDVKWLAVILANHIDAIEGLAYCLVGDIFNPTINELKSIETRLGSTPASIASSVLPTTAATTIASTALS